MTLTLLNFEVHDSVLLAQAPGRTAGLRDLLIFHVCNFIPTGQQLPASTSPQHRATRTVASASESSTTLVPHLSIMQSQRSACPAVTGLFRLA